MKKTSAYFDYAATTPLDPQVYQAMKPYFREIFSNANSVHLFGQQALLAIDQAREQCANFLGCKPQEIIFTSGATESNNLAILGLIKAGEHVITSSIEHLSVLEPCRHLENQGVEVTYVPVDKEGIIEIAALEKAIKPNTRLISVMYANNEIGTIQPIAEIGQIIASLNQERQKNNQALIYFHTDAVQAAAYCNMKVKELGVDLLAISGHKIYGPKGVGLLYKKTNVSISPIQFGGGQEFGLRPGTYNTAAIVGLGQAVRILNNQKDRTKNNKKITAFQDKIIREIKKNIPGSQINGDLQKRIPGNIHVSFNNIDNQNLLILLDQEGIVLSAGAACSAGAAKPSHVLKAIKLSDELASGSIRLTFGRFTTQKEINLLLEKLPKVIKQIG